MKTCKNHPEKKYYAKGLCRSCYEKELIRLNPEYHKRQLKNSLEWGRSNKEQKRKLDKALRIRKGPQTEKRFARNIFRNYKLSLEDYLKIKDSQNNLCAICSRSPALGKKLHLDHCHKTGKVRGLLCAQCNWYLGFIEKDYKVLQNILNYLNITLDGKSKTL